MRRTSSALLTVGDARGVERPADDVVAEAREILHAAATDQDDRMLLQVVPVAGDVGADLDAVGEAHARDLPQRRVRLLGRHRRDARAHSALLRSTLERGRLCLVALVGAALANKLVHGRHGERIWVKAGRIGWRRTKARRANGPSRTGEAW